MRILAEREKAPRPRFRLKLDATEGETPNSPEHPVLRLQRTIGNQATRRLLENPGLLAPEPKASAKVPGQSRPPVALPTVPALEPEEVEADPAFTGPGPGPATGMKGGGCPKGAAWSTSPVAASYTLHQPAYKRSNTESSKTSPGLYSFDGKAAVDCAAGVWRYRLTSVLSEGTIQLVYFTEDHYPAPDPTDDSGPLTNVTAENWKDIVKDLEDHKTGISGKWSPYRAEDLHEGYHWQTWKDGLDKEVPNFQTEVEKLTVSFKKAPTEAAAEKKLLRLATNAFYKSMTTVINAFNALGDAPGDPPYLAQVPAFDDLIQRIKDYAASQKW